MTMEALTRAAALIALAQEIRKLVDLQLGETSDQEDETLQALVWGTEANIVEE